MPFRFCSNTSKESTATLRNKLAQMGIETRDNEVWTSIGAVNSLLRAKGLARYVPKWRVGCLGTQIQAEQAIHICFGVCEAGVPTWYP